ncbi:DNA-methyltransferase [Methyloversatilis sp.]|uniref:DNA-methyltransferase n=1 Tax=Methyloversatilis sp. TaxID=2569862 RepID=UPI003D284E37
MIRVEIIGDATLYLGDALEVLQDIDGPFDALVTDPPYSSGGMTRGDRALQSAVAKYVNSDATHAAHNIDFTGDNRDSRSWAFWCSMWMALAHDRMRPGAYVMVFTDWRQLPSLTDAVQAGGFVWRGLVPWDKTESSRAPHTGYFRHQCEYVVWGSNGPLAPSEHGGPWPGCIRERVDHREKQHMTGKPVSLMADLLRATTPGGLILDPFMGSASTGVAALQLGRRFVGIEKSLQYFDVSCRRLEAAHAQGRLFADAPMALEQGALL